jgi:DNA-binding SARP family transcriptional activator
MLGTPLRESFAVTLRLLNAFDLRCGKNAIALPRSAQRLLAFIALSERPVQRASVAGTLWLDSPEERAAANLRSSLWRLNRAGHRLVDATDHQLELAPAVRVDVRDAVARAHALLTGSPATDEVDPRCAGLTGELLPDWYDDWVLIERERLRQLSLHALETLAERLLDAERLGEALEAALAAVAEEPLRESAHRTLVKIHLAEGNACEARRQFRLFSRLLDEQLGLAPSPRFEQLVGVLAAQRTTT